MVRKRPRTDDYRSDPYVTTGSADSDAYYGSGFDRGHLVPAGDMRISERAMSESFYMSNMAPQRPGFNRGVLYYLESSIRSKIYRYRELFIATGPVLKKDLERIKPSNVAIPKQFYKVIAYKDRERIKTIAYLLTNESTKKPISDFIVSVDEVEEFTGLDFFSCLDDQIEELEESLINKEL